MEPLRPLGQSGRALWDRVWSSADAMGVQEALLEVVQIACEQMDERQALRITVLRDGSWRDRAALRSIDAQLVQSLTLIADRVSVADGGDDPADVWLKSLGGPVGDPA